MRRALVEAAIYCVAVAVCLLIWFAGTVALIRQRYGKQ